MKLWSIQHQQLAEMAQRKRVVASSWKHVQEDWRPAYRWMQQAMKARGLETKAPPIWAWHSCGAWQRPPDADDILLFLGEMRPSLVMLTLEVPETRALLTRYGPWNELLEASLGGKEPLRPPRGLFFQGCPLRYAWHRRGNHLDIQACLTSLMREDIRSVLPLEDWLRARAVRTDDRDAGS